MIENIRQHTYMQLVIVGIVLMVGSLAFTGLAFGISSVVWSFNETQEAMNGIISSDNQVNILKLIQFASQLAMFIIPSLVLWKIMVETNPNYLGLRIIPSSYQLLLVVGLFIVSIPFLQYTILLNESMSLGESLRGIEEWMREQQDKNDFITEKFMKSTSITSLVANLVIMAIMPAIGEELFFRGVLMSWFKKATSNIHINILITSIIFSAIHFQFYGFIPRFLLGVALGYTYYWTKSLWAPILLHFTNNAITVLIYFYVN
ncbi:MAG: CPBP family intramembrane metalloprotease, partial [Bacteroidales bacterium]|nr:CPBP family intramembrane metalloprotease [Bacteroidales bacterium]